MFFINQLFHEGVVFLSSTKSETNISEWFAKEIKDHMLKKIQTFKEKEEENKIFDLEPIDNGGDFNDLLYTFRAIIPKIDFDILSNEIISLNEEIESNHNVSAALKVGRTLEYIIYTLAKKVWDVEINVPVLKKVNELNKDFKGITGLLIDYSYSEEKNKIDKKNKFKKHVKNINDKLMDLIFEMDDLTLDETIYTDIPINPKTVLEDVKKKFQKHDLIRNDLDIILKEKYLYNLLDLRNSAAHANISEKIREVEKKDIYEMITNLKIILVTLANINANIAKINNKSKE